MSSPKDVADVIAGAAGPGLALDLPVRLRAWDGSEAGPAGTARSWWSRSPQALQRLLWRPGELGLARAYVSGDLDVEGDLTDGLRRVHAIAPRVRPVRPDQDWSRPPSPQRPRLGLLGLAPPHLPGCELRVRGRRHSRARDQAVIAGHYDVPSAFYQLILDPGMAYSCAYWDGPDQDLWPRRSSAKLELIMQQARPRARARPCSTWAAAGAR